MDSLYGLSLDFIRWLQENYPQLEGFFKLISGLGSLEFYLAVLPLIYWTIDKRLGKRLGFVLFISIGFNTIFKQALRGPRPFWLDPTLGLLKTGGYGIPSGHTQNATALFLLIAGWYSRAWGWLLAIGMIFLMALSRIYLGDHFISDVIAGFLLGLLLLAGYLIWRRYFAFRLSKRILGQRLLVGIVVTASIALLYLAVLLLIGAPDLSVPWSEYIPEAELSTKTEMATAVGALLGFSIGIVLESARVRFRSDGPLGKRLARYILGIIVTVIIWRGLGILFPADPLWLAIPLRMFRYALVALWASYYAPAVFVRFRLADADPQQEINLKL
jgi:membrane-associated phospholipid phosphatase